MLVTTELVDVTGSGFGLTNQNGLSAQLTWRRDIPKHWEDYKYLFPLPKSALLTNPNLEQNPGWWYPSRAELNSFK